jgi:RNA polymerase sigma-70 factor (ECF subfamily)
LAHTVLWASRRRNEAGLLERVREMIKKERQSGFFPCPAIDRFDSDDDLIAGMLAKNAAAWGEFANRYDRLIIRCITKVTRRFASIVSQDDVREVYATLYVALLANDMHKLRCFDSERGNRFSSWIGLLAINAAYDHLRTLKREPQMACMTDAMDLVCELPDPFELVSEHERAKLAKKTLEDFSEKDRTFAALYFGEGMDPQDIADRMNISVKTVYSKKHKIKERLESMLTRAGACRRIAA